MKRRTRLLAPFLAAALAALAATAPVAAQPNSLQAYFEGRDGPVRILGLLRFDIELFDVDLTADLAIAGLPADSEVTVLGSTRRCARPHASGATGFSVMFRTGSDGARVRIGKPVGNLGQFEIQDYRSIRVFTRSGGTQVVCAPLTPVVPVAPSDLEDIVLSVVSGPGPIRGLAAFRTDAGGTSVSGIVTGLPAGSVSRIALADEACGDAVTEADLNALAGIIASGRGVAAVTDRVVANVDPSAPAQCIHVLKGDSGILSRASGTAFTYQKIEW